MALSLTCACGARFELEDTLAGQTITCPECQQALKAPALQSAARVTSLLALASAVMALVFAFTIIGSAAAVVVGFMALGRISRNRERLAGAGLALFGIITGLLFTGLTVFALTSGDELFGLGGQIREKVLAEQVDLTGPLEIIDRAHGFAITRPSRKWGVAHNNQIEEPVVHALTEERGDLLLAHLRRILFVDVRTEPAHVHNLDQCQNELLEAFKGGQPNLLRHLQDDDDAGGQIRPAGYSNLQVRPLPDLENKVQGRELTFDVAIAGQRWPFIVRLYSARGKIYVVRAFGKGKKSVNQSRPELDQILDSFRILN
jgi:hypothetical protein